MPESTETGFDHADLDPGLRRDDDGAALDDLI
jgi:hypothetical protein